MSDVFFGVLSILKERLAKERRKISGVTFHKGGFKRRLDCIGFKISIRIVDNWIGS